MKELLRKKSVKIALLLIILLVAAVTIGFNAQSAQRQNEYDNHIKAAEKYLTELDYEQAIAEYILAYEIEPSEEVLDALEQTYIAYAQSYVDAGGYESAISILEEGYAQTGRESLRERMEEVQAEMEAAQRRQQEEQGRIGEERRANGMVEFPFVASDITVMGYSLSENHFADIRSLFPTGEGIWLTDGTDPIFQEPGIDESLGLYYIETVTLASGAEIEKLYVSSFSVGSGTCTYDVQYGDTNRASGSARIEMYGYDNNGGDAVYSAYFNVPVRQGDSYGDWCRVMQIDRIKEYDIHPEQQGDRIGFWEDDYHYELSPIDGAQYWQFSTAELKGLYSEEDYENGGKICRMYFVRTITVPDVLDWPIRYIMARISDDGVVAQITYEGFSW